MNKITAILAGVATMAAVSVAPAFAQGNFTNLNTPFTFTDAGGTANMTISGITYNPFVGSTQIGTLNLTLTGGVGGNTGLQTFTAANLTFTSTGNPTIMDATFTNGADVIFSAGTAEITSVGKSTNNNSFNLYPGTVSIPAPVPETSTVASFGALLALGGLALVARRKSVKNAA